MKNIHILPTDKPSRLHLAYDKDFYLSVEPFIQLDTKNYKSFNIYITSDEEIKEGDWCLPFYNYKVDVTEEYPIYKMKNGDFYSQDKKIILTTDQDLIKDGVQAIDDEFLEWFVKNPSCEKVELQKWAEDSKEFGTAYSIIFPKEEPKQYPIGGYAPGNYTCTCVSCKTMFQGDKRAVQCEPCAIKMTQEKPKQETIEEFAKKYAEINQYDLPYFDEGGYQGIDENSFAEKLVNFTTKWQEQRRYSEEDIKRAFTEGFNSRYRMENGIESRDKFIEQFKKK